MNIKFKVSSVATAYVHMGGGGYVLLESKNSPVSSESKAKTTTIKTFSSIIPYVGIKKVPFVSLD